MIRRLAVLLVILGIIPAITPITRAVNTQIPSDFDVEIGKTLKLVNDAAKYGANVTPYTVKLNKAINAYENGDSSKAMEIVKGVEAEVSSSLPGLRAMYKSSMVRKYIVVGVLLALPVASYFLIPYFYYTLWYNLRKKWIIEEVEESAGK